MTKITIFGRWWIFGIILAAQSLPGGWALAADGGAPIPPSAPFTSPDIKPTFGDWLTAKPVALARKLATTDPLQRPPFAGAAPDSLKGMASGIRAVQLDAPNRVKAATYLGTVDCVTYPQAQEMLIATMQEDPSEDVRYAAVMALRNMLSRGCSNMETACECESCRQRKQAARETERFVKQGQKALIKEAKGPAKKAARQASKEDVEQRYDCCRGCCNAKALNALAKVAYDKDDQCCWVEPSERVRNAAAAGLSLCATYAAPYAEPAPIPGVPALDGKPAEVGPPEEKEVRPQSTPGASLDQNPPPAPSRLDGTSATQLRSGVRAIRQNDTRVPMPGQPRQVSLTKPSEGQPWPVIEGLKGHCVVGLKDRQFIATKTEYSSAFEDRTYFFSSAEAKAAFDRNPESYAPAYGGLDPVEWLEHHQMVEGQYLREFDGRFYLFVTKENWESFKSTPQRFVLGNSTKTKGIVAR